MGVYRSIGAVALGVVVCAVSATASRGTTAAATPAACGKLLTPGSGAYFGMMYPREWLADPFKVKLVERVTGRKVSFVTFTIPWGQGLAFPVGVKQIWQAGYVPLLRLFNFPTLDYDPAALPPSQYPGPYPMSAIAGGKFDDQIRAFADAARATDIPMSFELGTEVNNPHPWSGQFDGAGQMSYGDPSWPDGPEHFRDGYRHFVDIFRQEGATNVTFFFHVDTVFGYATGTSTEPFEQYRWYYPGDDYVDWMGLSVYSHPNKPDGSNFTFEEKLATYHSSDYVGSYAELAALGSRPIALNEVGFDAMPSESAKAAWVKDASAVLQSGRYSRIKALNWWGDDAPGGAYNADPLSSATFTAGYKAAFDQPYFNEAPAFGGDCRPLQPQHVGLTKGNLSWSEVPNAAIYEVFRGSTRIARTQLRTLRVGKAAGHPQYRVRGVSIAGVGPFGVAR
jgi:hypothetical protein